MILSNPTFWLMAIPTWVTGAMLAWLYFKKRSELKAKKVPVRIRVRNRNHRPY